MAEEPVKVHLSPEDQEGRNITVNELVQRFPRQQRVPLQCLREITWKLPQFWCEATAKGINGNSSVFKSYFIYRQRKKPVEFWQSLDTRSGAVLPMSSSILCLADAFPHCTLRSKWRWDSHPLHLLSCLLKAPSIMKADLWE